MASLSLSALVERLSPQAKETLEQAAAMASSRTHHSIELTHWLLTIVQHPSGIYSEVFEAFDIDERKVEEQLQAQLEKIQNGMPNRPRPFCSYCNHYAECFDVRNDRVS